MSYTLILLILISGSGWERFRDWLEDTVHKIYNWTQRIEPDVGLAFIKLPITTYEWCKYSNPAEDVDEGLYSSYTRYFMGSDCFAFKWVRKSDRNLFKVSGLGTGVADMELRDETGRWLHAYYGVYQGVFTCGYARVWDNTMVGVATKLIYERIYVSSIMHWAIGMGITHRPGENWEVGFVADNLGPMGYYTTERCYRVRLPIVLAVDLSYKGRNFTGNLEIRKDSDTPLFYIINGKMELTPDLQINVGIPIAHRTRIWNVGFDYNLIAKGIPVTFSYMLGGWRYNLGYVSTITICLKI